MPRDRSEILDDLRFSLPANAAVYTLVLGVGRPGVEVAFWGCRDPRRDPLINVSLWITELGLGTVVTEHAVSAVLFPPAVAVAGSIYDISGKPAKPTVFIAATIVSVVERAVWEPDDWTRKERRAATVRRTRGIVVLRKEALWDHIDLSGD